MVPELNCFDREMVEGYFSDLVNGIQTDEALDDWTLTVVLYIGTYLGANHISIWKHGITDTVTKEKVLTIGIPLPCSKTIRWGVKKKGRFTGKIPDESFRRNNRLLPVNFAKYDNMETYIEDNIRIALLNLFEVGFTLKGYKVKKR
ncbi:Imm9 family immunity protein [Bacteroides ovatus]|nr:Imm9 family immunity protein [Bacteroides ovatus]